MKKLLLFVMTALCLASCGEDSNVTGGGTDKPTVDPNASARTTQVYVQGSDLSGKYSTTRAMSDNIADAHYFIRIDNRIPVEGYEPCPSNLYWPKKAGNQGDVTIIADANKGTINLDYPYWTSSSNGSKYIFDTTGKSVEKALEGVPTLTQMLSVNLDKTYGIEEIDFSKYKVIWYVVKKENNGWHVDGVLTLNTTKDVTEVPGIKIDESSKMENLAKPDMPDDAEFGNGNVEVNIHEQLHKDWDEIKTSIHVRDLVDEVRVEIPIEQANMVESDDFAIRTYDYDLASTVFINGHEYALGDANPIKVKVEHKADRIVITVSAINHDYIKALREAYGDGVTVEVHSYPKNLSKDAIWNKIQGSKVYVLPGSYPTVTPKITKFAATELTE